MVKKLISILKCAALKHLISLFAILLVKIGFSTIVQATSVEFPPVIASLSNSPNISDLDLYTGCSLISLGGFGIDPAGKTYTAVKYCTPLATELEPFFQAGWRVHNNCTSHNSGYTLADTCNGYWPTLLGKSAECPAGYVLSSGMCYPNGKLIPIKIWDLNLV